MLNHITIMAVWWPIPSCAVPPKERRSVPSALPATAMSRTRMVSAKRTSSTLWRGAAWPRTSPGTFPRAAWRSLRGDCRSAPGQTVTTCGTTLLRSWPAASTLETASPKAKGAKTATNRLRAAISTRTVSCRFDEIRGQPFGLPPKNLYGGG